MDPFHKGMDMKDKGIKEVIKAMNMIPAGIPTMRDKYLESCIDHIYVSRE
jgi:hypothetical protein